MHKRRIHLTLTRTGRWWDDKRETEESLGMLCGQFLPDETSQAFQVLAVQFDVIVSGSFHPQRLHGFGAALIQGQPMGKIYHLVLCPMDDQHWRRDFRHFLNAEIGTHKWTQGVKRKTTSPIHREKNYLIDWKAHFTFNIWSMKHHRLISTQLNFQ